MRDRARRRFSTRRLRPTRRALALLVAVCLALVPVAAFAAEMFSGEDVEISSPVNDDVYAIGARVEINADVNGDVIATAAEIEINGHVTGSVYLAAFTVKVTGDVDGVVMVTGSDVTIDGNVGGTVRVAASSLKVRSSTIGGDLVALSTKLNVDDASRTAGDVVVRGNDVNLGGDVGGEIRGNTDSLEVGGTVGGPIDVHVGTLRFTEGAVVTQPVRYTSDHEVLVDGGTVVTGTLTRIEPDHPSIGERVLSSSVWAIFRFAWAFALGAFLLRVAPRLVQRTADIVRTRPFPALGWGLLAIVATPIVAAILMITVIGLPVGLVILAGFILALYASQIVLALIIGRAIAPRSWRSMERWRSAVGVLAIGLAIVVAVRAIPIPGWYFLTGAATAMLALGALFMQVIRRDQDHPAGTTGVRGS